MSEIKNPHDVLADRSSAIAEVSAIVGDDKTATTLVDIVDKWLGLPARKMLARAVEGYYDHADQIGVPDSWYLDATPYLGHAVSTSFFECTSCGAAPGDPCMLARGTRAKKNHEARKTLAAKHLANVKSYVFRQDTVDSDV